MIAIKNTVRSLPNTGYSNSESSTAFLMTSLLSGIALLSRKFKKKEVMAFLID